MKKLTLIADVAALALTGVGGWYYEDQRKTLVQSQCDRGTVGSEVSLYETKKAMLRARAFQAFWVKRSQYLISQEAIILHLLGISRQPCRKEGLKFNSA